MKLTKQCIILGDFNIDLSKDDNTKIDFINTLHSSYFFPTINKYTRVTESSKSVIDNFITNIQNACINSGVKSFQTSLIIFLLYFSLI